jgi:hypothetical protein
MLHSSRNFFAVVLGFSSICGCGERGRSPPLEPIALSLSKEWPRANPNLQLKMRAFEADGKVLLHCDLKNTSINPTNVILNRSHLPWTAPSWLAVVAMTADGKVLPKPETPVVVSILEAGPSNIVLKPGETLEGDVDIASGPLIPIKNLPRDKDILLIWSYFLQISTAGQDSFVSGATFLGRRD